LQEKVPRYTTPQKSQLTRKSLQAKEIDKKYDEDAIQLLNELTCSDREIVLSLLKSIVEKGQQDNWKEAGIDTMILQNQEIANQVLDFNGILKNGTPVTLKYVGGCLLQTTTEFRKKYNIFPKESYYKIDQIDGIDVSLLPTGYQEAKLGPEVHHYIPYSHGGLSNPKNARVLTKAEHAIMHCLDELCRVYKKETAGSDSNRRMVGKIPSSLGVSKDKNEKNKQQVS
jgi:hypothetical protein